MKINIFGVFYRVTKVYIKFEKETDTSDNVKYIDYKSWKMFLPVLKYKYYINLSFIKFDKRMYKN